MTRSSLYLKHVSPNCIIITLHRQLIKSNLLLAICFVAAVLRILYISFQLTSVMVSKSNQIPNPMLNETLHPRLISFKEEIDKAYDSKQAERHHINHDDNEGDDGGGWNNTQSNYTEGSYRSYGEKASCKARHEYTAKINEMEQGVPMEGGGMISDSPDVAENMGVPPLARRANYRYFLGAVIANRVFEADKFGVRPYEVKQWIEYMLYAGVEHVYWYDTAHDRSESQRRSLGMYIGSGIVTYHRLHGGLFNAASSIPRGYHFEQDQSYTHFLAHYADKARWVAELDVDEYPFSPHDRESCFLQRFVWDYELRNRHLQLIAMRREAGIAADDESPVLELPVTQILMSCIFFLGNPKPSVDEAAAAPRELEEPWVIEKYQRRKRQTEDGRRKPIFRADLARRVLNSNPHCLAMAEGGTTKVAAEERLRMNHYWGARTTDFGPDTPELLSTLVPDTSVDAIVSDIKAFTGLKSSSVAGGQRLMSNSSRPRV